MKQSLPSALSNFSIATKLDELYQGDRSISLNTDSREKTDLDQTCTDQNMQFLNTLSDSELILADRDEDGTEQLDSQSEAQDDGTSTSQKSLYVQHPGHLSGGYVPNMAKISSANPHNCKASNYPDHHLEDDLDGEIDLLDGALELVGDSAMTKDITFTESYVSIPHVHIPAPDVAFETSRGTLQTINGYIPKDPSEIGRKWPDHEHDEFALQLDDNDDVPNEEQMSHTTGGSYWTDAYLDNVVKQQQSQIRRDLPEMGENLPNHGHDIIEFTLQIDGNDVTQDVSDEQIHATDSSYWSEAYLDMKQQQTQTRRATYCATGYISTVHNA